MSQSANNADTGLAAVPGPPPTLLGPASLICFVLALLLSGGSYLLMAFDVPPVPLCASFLVAPLGVFFGLIGSNAQTESNAKAVVGLVLNAAFCVAWVLYGVVTIVGPELNGQGP